MEEERVLSDTKALKYLKQVKFAHSVFEIVNRESKRDLLGRRTFKLVKKFSHIEPGLKVEIQKC